MTVSSRRTLGVGLDAILGLTHTSTEEMVGNKELKQLMVNQLISGCYQPRREFDIEALQELADSISAQGILQPIIVRQSGKNEYEIIAGERRWRAAQMAGLQQVPAIVCSINDEAALAFALIENLQRQDLNPIEEAVALKRLIDEFGMTHDKVAKSIGRSRTLVTNTLRLLNLTPFVQDLLIKKKIEMGHAKMLMVFSEEEQKEIASIIVEKELTVREVEKIIHLKKLGRDYLSFKSTIHPKCKEWEKLLSFKLGHRISLKINNEGMGKIVVKINSIEELDRIINTL